jgi:uncharacterized protein YbbK (DUF523 family)
MKLKRGNPGRFDLNIFDGATPEDPLRVLVSECLTGKRCGWDGRDYGISRLHAILALPNVNSVPFCPEDFAFGTPRAFCSIHGGDGFDVLDGKARVLTVDGVDWTEGAVRAAHKMLMVARDHEVDLCLLLDVSPSCGSRVIYDGHPSKARYRRGHGVSAALLARHGFPILTHRDDRYLEELYSKLNLEHTPDLKTVNHFEDEWYGEYFKVHRA